MPKARLDLYGYKECTQCSTVSPYGHVHITNGKVGNDIQILPADVAEVANRYAKRTSSGMLSIMEQTAR